MKKTVLLLLIAAISIFGTACAEQKVQTPEKESVAPSADYKAQTEAASSIKEFVKERAPKEVNSLLYGDKDDIQVFVTSGSVSVYVHTYMSFCIPAAAEVLCPLILEAVEQTDYELGDINVEYCAKNSNGSRIEDSLVNWRTRDGITGTFVCAKDTWAEPTVIPSCNAEELYKHYQQYEDCIGLLRRLIEEDGGDPDLIIRAAS